MSEEMVGIIVFGTLGVLLLALGSQTLLRRLAGNCDDMLACRRCGSGEVVRLPSNEVVRHPGYRCGECGLRMRPVGSAFLYIVVLVVSLTLSAAFAYPLLVGGEGPVVVFPFMLIVATYAVWQLRRPTPIQRLSERESAGIKPPGQDARG